MKDMEEELEEEVHRMRSRRVLSAGTSRPAEFRVCRSPSLWVCSD